ncbi:MAG: carboxypeptidase-like regulatory domain-containing protein [Saprospiraceae bacterium]
MTSKSLFKISLFFIGFLLISNVLLAQFTIKGTVYDDLNTRLIGTNILIKGTTLGTITDLDGNFALESPDSLPVLLISYTGYSNKEVKVEKNKALTIQLTGVTLLDEVVMTKSSPSVPRTTSRTSRKASSKSSVFKSSRDFAYAASSVVPRSMGAEMSTSSAPKNVPLGYADKLVKSGTLTAGEINDFTKWDLWEDIAKEDLEEWQQHWQFKPLERYALQLTNENGFPVVDAQVSLVDKNGILIHQTKSDNTGKAELWAALFDQQTTKNKRYKMIIEDGIKQYTIQEAIPFQQGMNSLKIPTPCHTPQNLDIMMVVDATGSMGDELLYLKTELTDVIQQTQTKHKNLTINLGSVVYRDHEEEYLTRKTDFSTTIAQTISFLEKQSAAGGGDHPEAVEHALSAAIDSTNWSKNAIARLLFLVLDAPPHHSPKIVQQLHDLSIKAAAKGIKIIPVTGSGIGKSTEYLMRCLSLTTNGTYVFLTDDSGIGNPHIAPTTDTYKVELLNGLLVRLINQYTTVLNCEAPIASLQKQEEKTDSKTTLAKKLGLKIYPNPTTGPLTVSAKKDITETFLTDISGKILARFPKWKKGKNALNLGQYPSGIYFLQFKTSEGIFSKKVLVNHQLIAQN